MAQTISVIMNAEDRERLAAVLSDRNRPLKHIQRARIILLSAERLPAAQIARQAGVSRPSVWRWRSRFGESGVDVSKKRKANSWVCMKATSRAIK